MEFRSSRTLPGPEYASSVYAAALVRPRTCFPVWAAKSPTKCWASSRMSLPRMRRGGTWIGITRGETPQCGADGSEDNRLARHRPLPLREPQQVDTGGEAPAVAETDHVVAGTVSADRAPDHATAGDVQQLDRCRLTGGQRKGDRELGTCGIRESCSQM